MPQNLQRHNKSLPNHPTYTVALCQMPLITPLNLQRHHHKSPIITPIMPFYVQRRPQTLPNPLIYTVALCQMPLITPLNLQRHHHKSISHNASNSDAADPRKSDATPPKPPSNTTQLHGGNEPNTALNAAKSDAASPKSPPIKISIIICIAFVFSLIMNPALTKLLSKPKPTQDDDLKANEDDDDNNDTNLNINGNIDESKVSAAHRVGNDIDNDEKEILYFGYGSNLSLNNFIQFKNINVISYCCGIIYDWKLSFSYCFPTNAFANIHYGKGDAVHGVIMKLKQKDLNLLTKLETGYKLKKLKACSYANINRQLNVCTFIFDKQCEDTIKRGIVENKNIKQFVPFFDINGGKPEQNYLNTIIRGAKELKLDEKYIKKLQQFDCIPILKYNPTNDQIKQINNKMWTMRDIQQFIAKKPLGCISIFKGIVFDITGYPPAMKKIANGNDCTMFYAKRWAYANHNNCKSRSTLEDGQKMYLNGELQKLLNGHGEFNANILGKMDEKTYEYACDSYVW